jgi:hypothetical protein
MLKKHSASMSDESSLQRAAVASKGAFEACFSNGLDLSDFATTVKANRSSHAASLLRLKQAEVVWKLENEKEEANLQGIIHERTEALQQAKAKIQEDPLLQASPPLPTYILQQSASSSLEFIHSSLHTETSPTHSISSVVVAMHTAERKNQSRGPKV